MNQPRKIDSVVIEQLELDCVIGVNPWERLVNQRITIDITMDVDLLAAGKSDSIRDTVDYSEVVKAVTAEVNSSSYRLVEPIGGNNFAETRSGKKRRRRGGHNSSLALTTYSATENGP